QMHPGDRLFLYTDGIPEAINRFRKQYGTDNLVKALNEVKEADPEETLAHVRRSVDDFVKDAEQFDDLTMLCLKYNGRE
nr:serine/threonine-protein phosphatase [Solobacterium sp.]